jgi:dihydrolipoamide dehydrogenase
MREPYDIAFLGGGPAGYQGAIRAAQLGARVAVVEDRLVGGVCLNWGCIPTKAVRASAETGRSMRRAKEYGFKPVEVLPDMAAIITRKQRVVTALRTSIERLFQAHRIDLIEGRGRLVGHGRIEVQGKDALDVIEAGKVVVATGSSPARLPMLPQSPRIFVAEELLDITYLPKHLLVIGGGVVGIEMAAIFRELGSQVTLVEALDRIMPLEDAEMAIALSTILRRRKIKIHCGTEVDGITEVGEGLSVQLSNGNKLDPDTVLVAVGRVPNTQGLGLEELGVALDHGWIVVDEHLQTNLPAVYAAGDVTGRWLLAHVAFAEGICAAEHAFGLGSSMAYRVIPRCAFTIPEYAAVGLAEEFASAGHPIKIARFPFKSLGMAQALGELEGLVKIIAHAETDQILGAHIIGPHASDLISEIALAMRARVPSRLIMETIHGHPTLGEAVLEVAQALHGQAIHGLQE